MIIAVDFDGTVVDHRFPSIGNEVPGAVTALLALVADGHKLILWTTRSGTYLQQAVGWFSERGISLHGINDNPTANEGWAVSQKLYAHAYVDNAAMGCPLIKPAGFRRECVDWPAVLDLIRLIP